jgi:tetratricopeptide (TPR) repeat protein
VNALVYLGVCYYNLSDGAEAERHFLLALQRDPHHPVALFNLGIVYEQRKDPTHALEYYHRALESDPPPEMRQPLIEAVNRIQDQAAKAPGRSGG